MNCCIPAVVSRTVGSSCGIRDELAYCLWPLPVKKPRNRRLISLLCMRPVRTELVGLALVFHLFEFHAQVFEGPPEKPRDVHLAHADVVRYLCLRLSLVEAELEDLLLLALEAVDRLLKQQPLLEALDQGLVVRLQVDDRVTFGLVLAHRRVQARRVVGPPEGQRFGNPLDVGIEGLGQLLNRWRTPRLHGLVPDNLFRRLAQFLQSTWDPHRPALVPEVAFDLTQDVRGRVGRELDSPVHVEAVYGLYEADGGDLDQVVERLPAARELAGEELGQRELFLYYPLPGSFVAPLVVTDEQPPRACLVWSPVSAHDTNSTTVRQRGCALPSSGGSSTSASTPSPAREKRKCVGASGAWKPSRISTASSSPPTPTLARATIPASTRPTQDRNSSSGGSLRYAYSWLWTSVKPIPLSALFGDVFGYLRGLSFGWLMRGLHRVGVGRRPAGGVVPAAVFFEVVQDLLPAPRGRLPCRRHRPLVTVADVVREVPDRSGELLAHVLVGRVDRPGHPDHDASDDPAPTRHRYSSASGRFSPPRKVLIPRERPAVAEETLITPPLTPRVMTAVVWSSSPVIPATSPTAPASCENWPLILSNAMCVFPRSGTTSPETSLIDCSVVEKMLASLKNIHARTKKATAIPANSNPFISSTSNSKPQRSSVLDPGNPDYNCDREDIPPSNAPSRHDAPPDDARPVPRIENGGLPWRDADDGLIEMGHPPAAVRLLDGARNGLAVVPDLNAFGLARVEKPVEVPDLDFAHFQVPLRTDNDLAGTGTNLG